MRRNPIELAAVATAAVPGLTPTAVGSAPDDPADFDSALLLDSEGKRWRVRSPRHAEASTRLETEFLVLRAFSPAIRAELPFLMPTVAGTVRQGSLSTFVYSHLAGTTRSVEDLTAGSDALAREIGTTLAAIHDLPRSLVSNADLPSYTPNEFRQRRLNELDQAATTGKIPPSLLLRWEHALEDVSLWRFSPCVVHGDLHEDNLLVDGERVTAVTGWTDLRVGDPADDMAWLVAANEQAFVDAVLRHYTASRKDSPDNHLLRRAALSAEFALAQYLVKGIAAGDESMISEAEKMLAALADDIAEYGGQSISVEPLPKVVLEGPAGSAPAGATQPGVTQPGAAQAGATQAGAAHASGEQAGAVPVNAVQAGVVHDARFPGAAAPASPKVTLLTPAPMPQQVGVEVAEQTGVRPTEHAAARPAQTVPAVHVSPIPVDDPAAPSSKTPAAAQVPSVSQSTADDDTSTAAIYVIDPKAI